MQNKSLPSARTEHDRTRLTDKHKLSMIVHQLFIVWTKSNEDPNYTASLYKSLKGVISGTNAQRLRDAGVARKMFIKNEKNGEIRFRNGIAKPNEQMVLSLLEYSKSTIQAKVVCEVKKTDPELEELKSLLPELRELVKIAKLIKSINHD